METELTEMTELSEMIELSEMTVYKDTAPYLHSNIHMNVHVSAIAFCANCPRMAGTVPEIWVLSRQCPGQGKLAMTSQASQCFHSLR